MRNDLQDEPINIPSLMVSEEDELKDDYRPTRNKANKGGSRVNKEPIVATPQKSNGFLWFVVLLMFCVFSSAVVGLYWMIKETSNTVKYQLDERSSSTTNLTETTNNQLQKIVSQLNNQELATNTNLESVRLQIKQLTNKLTDLQVAQQKVMANYEAQEKRLSQLEEKITALSKLSSNNDVANQLSQLMNDVSTLKKSQASVEAINADIQTLKKQNLAQSVKSLQDDLLLLRSQLDAAPKQNSNSQSVDALQIKVNQQIQEMQGKIQNLQSQLDNRSPY